MFIRCALWLTFLSLEALAATSEPVEVEQAFFFDYIPPEQTWVIPTTEKCQNISIKWDRGAATGPNPVAPYTLQIYTSAFITPFLVDAGSTQAFDWPVPFHNGTLYQVCMFSSNGATGGCQDIYTVIPSNIESCNNVTFPDAALSVTANVSATTTQVGAALGQFAWVEECSDILIKPNEGVAPFTMTIAPTLAPPINITSDNTDAISWTVNLGRSASFFVSLASSDGKVWSYGPLHVGAGTTNCGVSSSGKMVSEGTAIGASVGSLAAGIILGVLFALLFSFLRRRGAKQEHIDAFRGMGSTTSLPPIIDAAGSTTQYAKPDANSTALSPVRYTEPGPSAAGRSNSDSLSSPYVTETTTVVRRHHDAGIRYPPASEDREVVELPPEYMSESGGDRTGTDVRADRLRGGSSLSSPLEEDEEEEEDRPRRYILSSSRPSNSHRGEKTGIVY